VRTITEDLSVSIYRIVQTANYYEKNEVDILCHLGQTWIAMMPTRLAQTRANVCT